MSEFYFDSNDQRAFEVPSELIAWGEGKSFIASLRKCFISSYLIKELEVALNQYFKIVNQKLQERMCLESLGLSGLYQEDYLCFNSTPELVRIDAGVTGDVLKIYEVQPRPGGMGFLKWFADNHKTFCLLTEKWKEFYGENVNFLNLTVSNPPYMKEMLYFVEGTRGKFVQEDYLKNGFVVDPKGRFYPRGNFLRPCPDYLKKLANYEWIVPPGYIYHPKAWVERVVNHLSLSAQKFFLPTYLLTSERIEEVFAWSSKERKHWVAKPSYGYGAAQVEDLKTFSNKKFLDSLQDWQRKIVLQEKFLSQEISFSEFDGPANWILRLYFVGSPLKFGGGLWNARRSFRVHGAKDAVFGFVEQAK